MTLPVIGGSPTQIVSDADGSRVTWTTRTQSIVLDVTVDYDDINAIKGLSWLIRGGSH